MMIPRETLLHASPSVQAAAEDIQELASRLSNEASRLLALETEIAASVVRQSIADLTSQTVQMIAREVALRFEKELDQRIAAAVAAQVPGLLATHACVPMTDVDDAVDRALDAALGRRIGALLGGGTIMLGHKASE